MPSSTSRESVAKLYVATFNRAPDTAGLDYWANSSNLDLAGIASSFFSQSETQALYPSETTDRAFVQAVYQNLFNREPDNDGLDYWEGVLNQGLISKDTFIQAIIDGAESPTGNPKDAAVLANKTAVGIYYADNGLSDLDKAYEVMSAVDSDSQTVDFAKTSIDIFVDDIIGIDEYIGTVETDSTTTITVTLEAGKHYTLSAQAFNDSSLDPKIIQVTDTTGTIIEGLSNDDSGASNSAKVSLSPSVTGNYTVTVAGEEGSSGNFWLGTTQTDTTESKEIVTLALGEEHLGNIALSFSKENYQVSLAAGQTYELQLKQSHGNTLNNPTIDSFLDPSGKSISNGEFSSKDGVTSLIFTATEAGNYSLNINDKFDDTGRYFVSLSAYEADRMLPVYRSVDDFSASTSTDGSLEYTGLNFGSIEEAGDTDWFEISMTAGIEYTISLSSFVSDLDTIIGGIYNTSGHLQPYTYNDDGGAGFNSLLTYTPTTSGTYYIEADGFLNSVGAYILQVTATEADDYGNATTAHGYTNSGSFITGSIEESGDKDWFQISLSGGIEYEFSLEAFMTSNLDTTIGGIYDSAGNIQENTYDDDGGSGYNSLLSWTPASTGNYFVEVTGYGSSTGDYGLTVNSIGESDDFGNSIGSHSSAHTGTAQGNIETGNDRDWFSVTLNAGSEYLIGLNATNSPLLDTVISGIYDANGVLQNDSFNDDGGSGLNSLLTFTANNTGTYFIEASSYGESTGSYDLSISASETPITLDDDLGSSVTSHGTIAVGGSEQGDIEVGGDRDWFEVSLTAGTTYQVNLLGSPSNHGSLADPYFSGIYNSNGQLIVGTANDDSNGYESSVVFTATESGDHYLSAGAYSSYTGSYTIQINEVAGISSTGTIETLPEKDWTIMIYIAADNDLEPFGLIDLNEMEIANIPDNVNVTFLIDRVNGYDTSDGNWTDTRRGIVESDNSMFTVSSDMESVGELNMGNPQTLTDFIDWNTQIAPADNYGLVIWDHGNGINGVAYDETSGHDNLSVHEISDAISTSSLDRLEFVGFDACLEAVIDQTYVLKDQTDVVIASQDLEPGDGWDYTGWFNSLTTNLTAESIAEAAVTSFDLSYDNSFQQTTLSAIKTSGMDNIASSLFTFSTELAQIDSSDLNSVKREVSGLDLFAQEYIDIRALAQVVQNQNISSNMNTAASNLISNIDEAVFANEVNYMNDAHGLSIYWPGTTNSSYEQNFELAETAGLSTLYDVFFS